jgi:hypothetical protein
LTDDRGREKGRLIAYGEDRWSRATDYGVGLIKSSYLTRISRITRIVLAPEKPKDLVFPPGNPPGGGRHWKNTHCDVLPSQVALDFRFEFLGKSHFIASFFEMKCNISSANLIASEQSFSL